MIDFQLLLILAAVILVLVFARYLQIFFEGLSKGKTIILKETKTNRSQTKDEADLLEVDEDSLAEKKLANASVVALLHILKNIVALETQHKKLVETGSFDKKLHSSNLISRIKVDYALILDDLAQIPASLEGAKDLLKSFQIMVEHLKYIDSAFQQSGLVRDYVLNKAELMEMRFYELKSLTNLLFLKALKLNPNIVNDEELNLFMTKHPAYFKIKN